MKLLALRAIKDITFSVVSNYLRSSQPKSAENKGWGEYYPWAELYHQLYDMDEWKLNE